VSEQGGHDELMARGSRDAELSELQARRSAAGGPGPEETEEQALVGPLTGEVEA